jgi:2-(1,2-epoxy-1,2-dihydrophenyl)acetyl-CoA isomerase
MAEYAPVQYHPNVRVSVAGHVTTVTIDRPESKNACTGDMWVAIGATFRDLAYSGTRVIVLTGGGEDFCAGADLTAPGSGADGSLQILPGMRVLGEVVQAVHDCPVPVVAKVDGVCVGAGLGLALAADLTWCSDRARFSAIFARRGVSLDFGTSWLLGRRIGVHRAKELAFTARIVGAEEALSLGLVNAVVSPEALDSVTNETVASIAAGPPLALSITKRELNGGMSVSLAQAVEIEALGQSVNVNTADMREAVAAFVEHRRPHFGGN